MPRRPRRYNRDIPPRDPTGMDSPIAHRTRAALRQQRENARPHRSRSPRDRIIAEDQPAPARPPAREYQEVPTCSICLSEMDVREDNTTLACSHLFHSTCIGTWRVQSNSCPLCRAVVGFLPPQDRNRRVPRRIQFAELATLAMEDLINLRVVNEIDEFGFEHLVLYV